MDTDSFLTPDQRWTIWGCNSFQEYMDRYFIPGKFHKDVPEKIRFAYLTVERLIAYSYYYYPLTEETDSKITRVFEMAVREKGKQLQLNFRKKFPMISDYINAFKEISGIDQELVSYMEGMKNLRNFYAHPDSSTIYGPAGFQKKYYYINFINRLFSPKEYYSSLMKKNDELVANFKALNDGVLVYENSGKRYVINSARPLSMAPGTDLSLWLFMPVLCSFPQTMEDYFETPPIFNLLTDIKRTREGLVAFDSRTDSEIFVCKSDKDKDLATSDFFKSQVGSSNITVKMMYNAFIDSTISLEREKFIYNEFWNQSDVRQ